MKLHENSLLFRQAIQATADQLQIPAIYVEKDYWVTFALYLIFHHSIGDDVVFKGGTALVKCYGIIERFSEDIDLVVIRREGETDSKLSTKIKKVGQVIHEMLPEIQVEGLTHKRGMTRKTAHSYQKSFDGLYGQVRDSIVVEATWLGYYEPYRRKTIQPFVGEMVEKQEKNLAEQFQLQAFEVQVLEPSRTLCEKIMSLVRFSYGEVPLTDLKKKIRHTYDLHQLLQNEDVRQFFETEAFDEMLLKVGQDDVSSFKNNNQWLQYPPKDALLFRELEGVWGELRKTYTSDFRNLIYGVFPPEDVILGTLRTIRARLENVNWSIRLQDNQSEN